MGILARIKRSFKGIAQPMNGNTKMSEGTIFLDSGQVTPDNVDFSLGYKNVIPPPVPTDLTVEARDAIKARLIKEKIVTQATVEGNADIAELIKLETKKLVSHRNLQEVSADANIERLEPTAKLANKLQGHRLILDQIGTDYRRTETQVNSALAAKREAYSARR